MGFRSQQNTSVIVNIIYWGALKPILYYTSHTFHQALEEIVSQRIELKPRLFIHSYNYRSSNIHKCQSGLLRTPDGYSGWLLRMATPDYSGWLRRPQGFCAVKLTLFIQFRWQLVWMCRNGSSPPRTVPHNKPYVHAYSRGLTLDIYQNTAVCRTFFDYFIYDCCSEYFLVSTMLLYMCLYW